MQSVLLDGLVPLTELGAGRLQAGLHDLVRLKAVLCVRVGFQVGFVVVGWRPSVLPFVSAG